MGFLSPLFLAAAVAVAVPLLLHLVQRHESRRVAFPALRYLLRTERDHARRIRFRQLLLLLLRIATMVLLVLAGARLFLRGDGGAHEATALALVVDNSLSSARVVGEERALDRLLALAEASLALAGPDDRIWVIRAGEPWEVVTPGDAAAALRRIRETEVSAAASDLDVAVARAAALVRDAGMPAAEVQLLSDLQATAFADTAAGPAAPEGLPVVAWAPREEPEPNRHLADVRVGGGLAPLAGRRSDVTVTVGGPGGDSAAVPLRLVVGDRIRAAGSAPVGSAAVLPFGPFPSGWIEGYVETDPDALRADDRRWFALRVRPPPRVVASPGTPAFLAEALAVLEEGGRIVRVSAGGDVAVSVGAAATVPGGTTVVVPPDDAALLPALNRRLATLGVPWRYAPGDGVGETRLGADRTPARLEGLRVRRAYRLEPPAGQEVLPEQVLARLADGAPWLVEGSLPDGGRYRLLASPFVPDATELPVSASMVPLVEWLLTPAGDASGEGGILAGEAMSLPSRATAVETPGGTRLPVDGTQVFRFTREAGVHVVLAGDSVLERVAVNPPPRESLLAPLSEDELEARLGGDVRTASDPRSWSETVFTSRQGPELWRPLLLAALVLLLLEGWVAASGRATAAASRAGSRATPREDRAPAA